MTNRMPSELAFAAGRVDGAIYQRDKLIAEANAAGMSYRAIAAAVGLSHTRVGQIVAEQSA